MSPLKSFTEHPASVGETYCQHLAHAGSFGIRMVVSGLACLVHGVFPFLFERTGSQTVTRLHDRMVVNRTRLKDGQGIAAARG